MKNKLIAPSATSFSFFLGCSPSGSESEELSTTLNLVRYACNDVVAINPQTGVEVSVTKGTEINIFKGYGNSYYQGNTNLGSLVFTGRQLCVSRPSSASSTASPRSPVVQRQAASRRASHLNTIAQKANNWVAKTWIPGEFEHCMTWVRQVLREAVCRRAAAFVTNRPSDGFYTGAGFASSLAGTDVGQNIGRSQLQAGDLVFFRDSSDVEERFRGMAITHVGIMVSSTQMVHRPTQDGVVKSVALSEFDSWIKRTRSGRYAGFFHGIRMSEALCNN